MAIRGNIGTGPWNTAGTWGTLSNTPTLHTSNSIIISTSNVYTATFTAPNTTNALVQVVFHLVSSGASASGTL